MAEAAFWLFGGIAMLVGLFLPTLVALFRGSDRLFITLLANCTVFVLGPIGTLLALFVLASPRKSLDGIFGWTRGVQGQGPAHLAAMQERNCPACQKRIPRVASACLHCHAAVEPLEQECPACLQPMPPTATTCLSCGFDQKAA
jgi:Double zinc ribbon